MTMPKLEPSGQCFPFAWREVTKLPDAQLVHGEVHMPSLLAHGGNPDILPADLAWWTPHAWVEHNGMAYDSSSTEPMPVEEYRQKLQARPEQVYSQAEAIKKAMQNEHYGPWDAHTAKIAMPMTRKQLLEQAATLAPDTSEVIHQYPDGWTVRRPTTFSDIDRTGRLMSNCWDLDFVHNEQHPGPYDAHPDWPTYTGEQTGTTYPVDTLTDEQYQQIRSNLHLPIPSASTRRILTDPDGLPHVVWTDWDGQTTQIHDALGRHNSQPKPEYIDRLEGYAQSLGKPYRIEVEDQTPAEPVVDEHGNTSYEAREPFVREGAINPVNHQNEPLIQDELQQFATLSPSERLYWRRKSRALNQRARRQGAPGVVQADELHALMNRFGHSCAYCDQPFTDKGTFDHVIPLGMGGQNTADNIVPACLDCNRLLNDWTLGRPMSKTASGNVMYHASPRKNREAILAEGLKPGPFDALGADGGGVYVTSTLAEAQEFAAHWLKPESEWNYGPIDFWEIDASGLPVVDDTNDLRPAMIKAYKILSAIEPSRLRLVDAPGSSQEPPTQPLSRHARRITAWLDALELSDEAQARYVVAGKDGLLHYAKEQAGGGADIMELFNLIDWDDVGKLLTEAWGFKKSDAQNGPSDEFLRQKRNDPAPPPYVNFSLEDELKSYQYRESLRDSLLHYDKAEYMLRGGRDKDDRPFYPDQSGGWVWDEGTGTYRRTPPPQQFAPRPLKATRLVRNFDNSIGLKYHDTQVVKFHPTGNIELNTGGWYSRTTMDRMNYAKGVDVFRHRPTEKGVPNWWVSTYATRAQSGADWPWSDKKAVKYFDGMIVDPNGQVLNPEADPGRPRYHYYSNKWQALHPAQPQVGQTWVWYPSLGIGESAACVMTIQQVTGDPERYVEFSYHYPAYNDVGKESQWWSQEGWDQQYADDRLEPVDQQSLTLNWFKQYQGVKPDRQSSKWDRLKPDLAPIGSIWEFSGRPVEVVEHKPTRWGDTYVWVANIGASKPFGWLPLNEWQHYIDTERLKPISPGSGDQRTLFSNKWDGLYDPAPPEVGSHWRYQSSAVDTPLYLEVTSIKTYGGDCHYVQYNYTIGPNDGLNDTQASSVVNWNEWIADGSLVPLDQPPLFAHVSADKWKSLRDDPEVGSEWYTVPNQGSDKSFGLVVTDVSNGTNGRLVWYSIWLGDREEMPNHTMFLKDFNRRVEQGLLIPRQQRSLFGHMSAAPRTSGWSESGPNGEGLTFQPGDRVELPSGGGFGTVIEVDPPEMDDPPFFEDDYQEGDEENYEGTYTTWMRVKKDDGEIVQVADSALRFVQGLDGGMTPDTLPWKDDEQDYYRTSMAERSPLPTMEELQPFIENGECHDIAQALVNAFGKSHGLRWESGAYIDETAKRNAERYLDHSWTTAPDGTILDTTHGQFYPNVPVMIARPGTPEYARYLPADDMSEEQRHHTFGDNSGWKPGEKGYTGPYTAKQRTGDPISEAITEFAPQVEQYRGQDMCGWTAAQFARLLASKGIESEVVNFVAPEQGTEHEVCEVGGKLIDWSAEQFGIHEYPFIATDIEDYAEHGVFLQEQKRVPYFAKRAMAERTMYHVAHVGDRGSIMAHGLDHERGESQWREDFYGEEGSEFPVGNYLFVNYEDALSYGDDSYEYDIWAVNTEGLNLVPDPYHGGAYYSTTPIPVQRLDLIRVAEGAADYDAPEWKKQAMAEHLAYRVPVLIHKNDPNIWDIGTWGDGHLDVWERGLQDDGAFEDFEQADVNVLVDDSGRVLDVRPLGRAQGRPEIAEAALRNLRAEGLIKTAMAERTGEQGQVMYHGSHPDNRESILQHGIDWRKQPEREWMNDDEAEHFPYGNYMWHSLGDHADQDTPHYDIWAVDVSGLPLISDPVKGYEQHAAYVTEPIAPERVKLFRPAQHGRTSMAEHTGDPKFDALLQQFMHEEHEYIDMYRDTENATGVCVEVTNYFINWLRQHGVEASSAQETPNIFSPDEPGNAPLPYEPQAFGYDNFYGDDYHDGAIVKLDGNTFLVDWTAAQFHESEFPKVKLLDRPARTYGDKDEFGDTQWEHPNWLDQWQSKTSMAERTGDPTLDKLIEEYFGVLRSQMKVEELQDPQWAAGACVHETQRFVAFLQKNGVDAFIDDTRPYRPDEFGYQDRPLPGKFNQHIVAFVKMPSGTYMIDWTAAQYGYQEFPMVQRLNDEGSWDRQWTAAKVAGVRIPFIATSDEMSGHEDGSAEIENREGTVYITFTTPLPTGVMSETFITPLSALQEGAGHAQFEGGESPGPTQFELRQEGQDVILDVIDAQFAMNAEQFWAALGDGHHIAAVPIDYDGGYRERWQPGDRAFFEYHCNQAHDSAHAQWWYRSHQPVTVVGIVHESPTPDDGGSWTFLDRGEEGSPHIYRVRWDDGSEGDVFEDELLTAPEHKDQTGYFAPPPDWQERIAPITDPSGVGKQGKTSSAPDYPDRVLHRDLPTLIPGYTLAPDIPEDAEFMLQPVELRRGTFQRTLPSERHTPESYKQLSEAVQNGTAPPVVVSATKSPLLDDPFWDVRDGFHRGKVALDAGMTHLPAYAYDPNRLFTPKTSSADLSRFVQAQEPVYQTALSELQAGQKRTHWMWYIFPQIAGLGRSEIAQHYALSSLDEARQYAADPVLGPRLVESAQALLNTDPHLSAEQILGPIDAMKLQSSMTLFARATGNPVFQDVLARFYGGEHDAATDAILNQTTSAAPQLMYHVSPRDPDIRRSIMQHGIDFNQDMLGLMDDPPDHRPLGNFLWPSLERARSYYEGSPSDIWEVNAEGLNLVADPDVQLGDWGAMYSTDPILPERIRLLDERTASIDDRMHEISDQLAEQRQEPPREPWTPQIPQKAIEMAIYKHQCPMCRGYLRDRGGVYTCTACPFEWPQPE
jgi:uncharacterized protein (DUF1810 family)